MQLLLEAKAAVDQNRRGATPLIVAAQDGQAPVVKLLLEAKASTTARWETGETALDTARREGHAGVAYPGAPAPPPEAALGRKLVEAAGWGDIAQLSGCSRRRRSTSTTCQPTVELVPPRCRWPATRDT